MSRWFRRIAAGLLLALPLGLFTAPPQARAADPLEAAAEALAEPGVHVDEGFETLSADLITLMRARYARADLPVRAALLTTETDDADALARQLAARVGRPGVYIVQAEWDDPTEDYPDWERGWALSGVALTEGELRDAEFDHVGINVGNLLVALPDHVDGDLSARLPTGFGDGRFFVDPAVTDAFPGLDAALLEETFADVPRLRVALVSGIGQDSDTAAAAMAEGLGADGAMLLMQWDDDAFSAVLGAGEDLPAVSALEEVVGGSAITEIRPGQMPSRLAQLAAALGPGLIEAARTELEAGPLYVHPATGDGVTDDAALAAYAEALAAVEPPVRVAFLPETALAAQIGQDVLWEEPEVARRVAGDDGGRVVVYLPDLEYGRMSWTHAVGDADFRQAVRMAMTPEGEFVGGTLDNLLDQLGAEAPGTAVPPGPGEGNAGNEADGEEGNGAAVRPGRRLLAAGVLVVLVAPVLVPLLSPRRRRTRAAATRARRLVRLSPGQRADAAARAEPLRAANQRELDRLAEHLSSLPDPGGPVPPAASRVLGEYERLLAAHAASACLADARAVQRDLARVRRAGAGLYPGDSGGPVRTQSPHEA